MAKNNFLFLFLFLTIADAQISNKFWVEFKDKNNTPYSLSNPTAYLSPASVQRRQMYNIPIDSTDLPVKSNYIQSVASVPGVTVLYASKWMNAVAIAVTNTNALNTIQTFTFVKNHYAVNRYKVSIEKDFTPANNLSMNRLAASSNYYGIAWWQTKMLNLDCLHSAGFRGQGMKIAVMDSGFGFANTHDVFDSLFARGGVLGTRDFVSGGTNVYDDDTHGTAVLSCMAGLWPNKLVGSAPRADYWLLRTEDVGSETPSEEFNWIRAIEFADSVGCDVANTSLGYNTFDKPSQNHLYSQLNGKTIPMSRAATMAARKGMLIFNSAGNEGGSAWQYITVPADADSIVTVGSVDSLGIPSGFSSRGPTADGRIKPDFVARGSKAAVALAWSNSVGYSNGTSFSSPILAGAMACFWQKNKTLHPVKIIDSLKKTSSLAAAPNNTLGWGVPNMCYPTGLYEIVPDNQLNINIFPIPFRDHLYIESWENQCHITLSDITGKVISEYFIDKKGKHTLSVEFLSSGVYFLHIKKKSFTYHKKIIKE
ncbi:MAG: S8 family peptidase [Bacteroidia bacterium]|nr:S8 family peptidase [Bacteroidia bacterium]